MGPVTNIRYVLPIRKFLLPGRINITSIIFLSSFFCIRWFISIIFQASLRSQPNKFTVDIPNENNRCENFNNLMIHACLDYTLMDYSCLDYLWLDYKDIWTITIWTTYDVWTTAVWTTPQIDYTQLDYLWRLDYCRLDYTPNRLHCHWDYIRLDY